MNFKRMKIVIEILFTMGMVFAIGVFVYAASSHYYKSQAQKSSYDKIDFFEFTTNSFFNESGGFGPGDTKEINPVVTSNSSIDSFVVIVVEMPKYGNSGLYEINKGDDWTCVETWMQDTSWFEAYRYDDTLSAGADTTALGDAITMTDMTHAQYGQLNDLDISMTAYACGTDEETLSGAWDAIKTHFNLAE